MKFRTEIQAHRGGFEISHDSHVLMLGSCFTENIGAMLADDGFDVAFNPMGPLYNPLSLARIVGDLIDNRVYVASDLQVDDEGVCHCLDFASTYQSVDCESLLDKLNGDFQNLKKKFDEADVLIITFGSSFVYSLDKSLKGTVGNCHKFPAKMFTKLVVDVEDAYSVWRPLVDKLTQMGKHIILTVSPIRHLADGLHGNQLSKARLLLLCDKLADAVDYFPSYEILCDDLRDYRFYAADMRHPSDTACRYIYEHLSNTYFSKSTVETAEQYRRQALRAAHRPNVIL